jgi:hypothetical protein
MTIELLPRDLVDAATANEELAERISVAQAIAMFRLPLPGQSAPASETISMELKLAS